MPKTEVRKAAERLILEHAKPKFKEFGYSKNGWTWSKQTESGIIRLFTVDFRSTNDRDLCEHSAKVAVCSEETQAAFGRDRQPPRWHYSLGVPSMLAERLVLDEVRGYYLSVSSSEGVTPEHHEGYALLVDRSIEWLESVDSPEDQFEKCVELSYWNHAATVGMHLGRSDAVDVVRTALLRPLGPNLNLKPRRRIWDTALRHGIDLSGIEEPQ